MLKFVRLCLLVFLFSLSRSQEADSSGEPHNSGAQNLFSDLWLPNHNEFARFSHGEPEELYCSEIIRFFPELMCSQEIYFGRGGGGITFIVKDTTGKEFMLKVQELDLLRGIEALMDVQGHENIIEVWKAQVIGKHMVEITTFADSGNLTGYQQRNPHLFERRKFVYNLLGMIWNGVSFVHSKGIVHADLKLANIVVDKTGVPKIIDFDLCVREGEQKGVRGTISFMSPEVFAVWESGQMHYSPKVDVFALGAMLYHFLFKTTPFTGSKKRKIYESLRKKTFAVPQATPIRTAKILNRMLRWQENERADMNELRDLIANELHQQDGGKILIYDSTISIDKENIFLEEIEWLKIFDLEEKALFWTAFGLLGLIIVATLRWNFETIGIFLERLGNKRKKIFFF